ncbi:MAG TPA: MlaD family protein [Acidiphilium sp.]|nr:MAG: mammalian cell entry protein [Acidiphilium sp. 21-60-14]OYV89515.1 MAG: mammalian cell entry protein [Acidiphilium sp. 37-60-79]OZB39658.1 MAG: mammalian cell entry protein [Acidiphilium sp. 34-60-192]HQT87466.1 MlaD family protein [Acidiphilium sp.]HQU24840.1 MlaD family protein [Acidiphilium sp.]
MEPRGAALRTGLFALGAVVALVGLIFLLSGNAFRPGIPYETYFTESVQGLDVGSPVKFRGVTIGKVSDIGLVAAEYPPEDQGETLSPVYQQVIVRFRIDPHKLGEHANIQQAIDHGLRVQVAPQGITGLAYLELSFVKPAQHPVASVPWTPRSTVIPSVPSTLTQVQDAVQGFLANARKIKFDKTIKAFNHLVQALGSEMTVGTAHQTLLRADSLLATMQTQLREADLPATTRALRQAANGPNTRALLASLAQSSAALAKASAAMPKLLAQTSATVQSANAATANLNRQMQPILQNLNIASRNLAELSESLKQNPATILRGAPPPRVTPR